MDNLLTLQTIHLNMAVGFTSAAGSDFVCLLNKHSQAVKFWLIRQGDIVLDIANKKTPSREFLVGIASYLKEHGNQALTLSFVRSRKCGSW